MCQDGLTKRGKHPVVKERRLVGGSPQAFREEAAIALTELWSPGRLVLVEWLAGIRWVADIVQAQIGVCGNPDHVGIAI